MYNINSKFLYAMIRHAFYISLETHDDAEINRGYTALFRCRNWRCVDDRCGDARLRELGGVNR